MSINNDTSANPESQPSVEAAARNDRGKLRDILIALGLVLIGCVEVLASFASIPAFMLIFGMGSGLVISIPFFLAPIWAGIPALLLSFSDRWRTTRRLLLICNLWLPASVWISFFIVGLTGFHGSGIKLVVQLVVGSLGVRVLFRNRSNSVLCWLLGAILFLILLFWKVGILAPRHWGI